MIKGSTGFLALIVVLMMMLSSCTGNSTQGDNTTSSLPVPDAASTSVTPQATPVADSAPQIYLYGEQHGVAKILEKEFDLWSEAYSDGMRHLFIEVSYYAAAFMNQWMQADDDTILDTLYNDWDGTAMHTPDVKAFYKKIKDACPDTVFHGTDVGHQRETTGARYLKYLEENNQQDTPPYRLTQESIAQGQYYYEKSDDVYRENKMAENFIRTFDSLNGESIMGIYGAAHTVFDTLQYGTQSVPSMANQLKKQYDNSVHAEDLALIAKDIQPLRTDTIQVGTREYTASFFGEETLIGFADLSSRAFWRLENAYDDFKDKPQTGDVLPYENYPMLIETGQVFVIDYTKTDGSVARGYYRADGKKWQGRFTTVEFSV